MNKQQKIVAISGIFVIIAGMSVAMNLEKVDAAPGAGVPLKQFGAATAGIVCGDRLCSEPISVIDIEDETQIGTISEEDSTAPTAMLMSVDKYKISTSQKDAITHRITFSLTAGTVNLQDIQLHIQSDVGQWEYTVSSLNALKSSVNVIRVKALDADSITTEIVAYSLTGPTGSPER